MWLLRRKTREPESIPEVLPPASGPMRRVEITVERRWMARLSPNSDNGTAEPADSGEPTLGRRTSDG